MYYSAPYFITIAGGFLVLAGAGPGALALDNRLR